ncbi:MAG: DUF4249 domain-containing protein [Ginsengibacter sp.]
MTRKVLFKRLLACCLLVLTLSDCKDAFDPILKQTDLNSLVVEGYIDGAVPAEFKISRSRILSNGDTASRHYEVNARVFIEDDQQNTYPLTEMGSGSYSSVNTLSLSPSHQYRLHIFTADNREYLSDFVEFKQSPAIDTIGWKINEGGVQISLNTHDVNNATRFYRWEYNETWEFHSYYVSRYMYDAATNTVIDRTNNVYKCWKSNKSTNILVGSSAKLTDDVISEIPLTYIEPHNFRLSVLYSIWVRQYALDINGYNYLLALRNNTEKVGSIFDPQPNQTKGNIHCITDPSETVIGYAAAGTSIEKRIFINNDELPPGWNQWPYCRIRDTLVPNNPDSLKFNFGFSGAFTPLDAIFMGPGPPVGYSASLVECVDCTVRGTNIKPSFWP